jgi:hypothetical protein
MVNSSVAQPYQPKSIQSGIMQGVNGQMYTTSTFDELWDDNRPLQLGRRRLCPDKTLPHKSEPITADNGNR